MKKISTIAPLSILLISLTISTLCAQTPLTWSERIAPIFYKNCTSCHHTGGVAPFSLMTFNDSKVRPLAIHHAILIGHMPPWPPDPKYREFAFQRALNDDDRNAIIDWVNQDYPEGDPSKAPTKPVYDDLGFIKTPDFAVRTPKFTETSSYDDYRCFPFKSGLTADKFITALECVPGNTKAVHHVLIFQDQSNACFDLDAADAAPGYSNFGGVGSNSAELIGGWVPGSQPNILPPNMGIRLKANANIILQVHYAGGSTGQSDSTVLKFRFSPTNGLREVKTAPILNHSLSLTNGPLVIPANTTRTFNAQFYIPTDLTIINIAPHMHLIARTVKSWAVPPTGDTMPLINIKNWDFHWQGGYTFKKAIKLPRGTYLKSEAFYDNTTANPNQPNSPPKLVQLGESTTDEMMLIYFSYLLYQAGDENLNLEGLISPTEEPLSKTIVSCFPNPSSSGLTVRFALTDATDLDVQVFDYQGVMVKNIALGQHFLQGQNDWQVPTSDLANGVYFVKISSPKVYGVQSFVVEK